MVGLTLKGCRGNIKNGKEKTNQKGEEEEEGAGGEAEKKRGGGEEREENEIPKRRKLKIEGKGRLNSLKKESTELERGEHQ